MVGTGVTIFVGTAGWAIGTAAAPSFPGEGTGLGRYASLFHAVEVNSSFHRPHRLSTWQKWRDSVPADFRFAVKMPKTISHERKLIDCEAPLELFLDEVRELGDKLGVLLLQLPPKLEFDPLTARGFLEAMRARCSTPIVCEPRHASWFEEEADALLRGEHVARVAADPARHEGAGKPGGWDGLAYYRLHGSPVMYRSSYADRIDEIAGQIRVSHARPIWCMFDNTASSAAVRDALLLREALAGAR